MGIGLDYGYVIFDGYGDGCLKYRYNVYGVGDEDCDILSKPDSLLYPYWLPSIWQRWQRSTNEDP